MKIIIINIKLKIKNNTYFFYATLIMKWTD